jgi:hypothetical protein
MHIIRKEASNTGLYINEHKIRIDKVVGIKMTAIHARMYAGALLGMLLSQ